MTQDNPTRFSNTVYVILPCQNEEEGLAVCLQQIQDVFQQHNIQGEIIVSDSSTDQSPSIAKQFGVTLIKHDKNGYGVAYQEAFDHVPDGYIFCADPDGSYDFSEIPRFITEIEHGADFVIGNRFTKGMRKKSMPWTHKYIGNPLLSFLIRMLFGGSVHDAHCGMRGFRSEILETVRLETTGMEFASEMVIKCIEHNLTIKELPISYYPRLGTSKLKTISDGFRHLRYILSEKFLHHNKTLLHTKT